MINFFILIFFSLLIIVVFVDIILGTLSHEIEDKQEMLKIRTDIIKAFYIMTSISSRWINSKIKRDVIYSKNCIWIYLKKYIDQFVSLLFINKYLFC